MLASESLFVDEIIAFAIYLESHSINSLLLLVKGAKFLLKCVHMVNVMYLLYVHIQMYIIM